MLYACEGANSFIFYNKLCQSHDLFLSCDGSSQRNCHVTEVWRLITLLCKGGDISFGDNRGSLRGLGRGYSIERPKKASLNSQKFEI